MISYELDRAMHLLTIGTDYQRKQYLHRAWVPSRRNWQLDGPEIGINSYRLPSLLTVTVTVTVYSTCRTGRNTWPITTEFIYSYPSPPNSPRVRRPSYTCTFRFSGTHLIIHRTANRQIRYSLFLQVVQLIELLTQLGPYSLDVFIEALTETDNVALANALKWSLSHAPLDNDN